MESEWVYDNSVLTNIINLLQYANSQDNETQNYIAKKIAELDSIDDIICYLTVVFVNDNIEDYLIRQSAGLLLKTKVANLTLYKSQLYPLNPDGTSNTDAEAFTQYIRNITFMKNNVLRALCDKEKQIRTTAGTIIATIMRCQNFNFFEDMLTPINQLMVCSDNSIVISAIETLGLIFEDVVDCVYSSYGMPKISRDVSEQFFKFCSVKILPNIFKWTNLEVPVENRYSALLCLTNLQRLFGPGQMLYEHNASYFNSIFIMAQDFTPEIRKLLTKALWDSAFTMPTIVIAHLPNLMKYLLEFLTPSQSYEVKLHTVFFLTAVVKDKSTHNLIEMYLEVLFPLLVNNTEYSETDYLQMNLSKYEDDNVFYEYSVEELEPQFHKPSNTRMLNNISDDYDTDVKDMDTDVKDMDTDVNDMDTDFESSKGVWGRDWTVRKAAATLIDCLSTIYGDSILKYILPSIFERLESSSWEILESGVLTLGAIAPGCIEGLDQYLPKLIKLLIKICNDQKAIIRSIGLWSISRFSIWIAPRDEVLKHVIETILLRVLDSNISVQEASCSAIACLEEEASESLKPYLPMIIDTFSKALSRFKTKNIIILLDSIRTLSESLGTNLDIPQFHKFIVKPLVNKWASCSENEPSLVMMFECIISIISVIWQNLEPYIDTIFSRCLGLTEIIISTIQDPQSNSEEYDSSFELIECSFDTISVLCQKAGQLLSSLGESPKLINFIKQCLQMGSSSSFYGIKRSALLLYGEMIQNTPCLISSNMFEIFPLILPLITVSEISISNNACWAIGQMFFYVYNGNSKLSDDFVKSVIDKLVIVIKSFNGHSAQSASVTMGRIALVYPQLILPLVNYFFMEWCKHFELLFNDNDKIITFQGILNVVQFKLDLVLEYPVSFIIAALSLYVYSPVSPQVGFDGYSKMDENFTNLQTSLPDTVRENLERIINWMQNTDSSRWEETVKSLSIPMQLKLEKAFFKK